MLRYTTAVVLSLLVLLPNEATGRPWSLPSSRVVTPQLLRHDFTGGRSKPQQFGIVSAVVGLKGGETESTWEEEDADSKPTPAADEISRGGSTALKGEKKIRQPTFVAQHEMALDENSTTATSITGGSQSTDVAKKEDRAIKKALKEEEKLHKEEEEINKILEKEEEKFHKAEEKLHKQEDQIHKKIEAIKEEEKLHKNEEKFHKKLEKEEEKLHKKEEKLHKKLEKKEERLHKEEEKQLKKLEKKQEKLHKKLAKKLRNRNATNKRRKFMHASFGFFFASLNHAIPKEVFVPGMAVLSSATLLMELLRYRKGFAWMNHALHFVLGKALRKNEMDGKFTGSFYFFTGVTLTAALFPTSAATMGIIQLAIADPSASYFGRATRHIYWSRIENGLGGIGRNKGFLGFLGGALFCVPFNYRILSLAKCGAEGVPGGRASLAMASLALGAAGAFADLAVPTPALTMPKKIWGFKVPPFHLDDNFVVPIVSGFACTQVFRALGWPQNLELATLLFL